jgi:hypothetical protein
MRIKLPLLLLIICFNLVQLCAQVYPLRKVKFKDAVPHFWLIGINDSDFPQLKNGATIIDSVDYGKAIETWIERNESKFKAIESNLQNQLYLNFEHYLNFTDQQRDNFNAISKESETILMHQKDRIEKQKLQILKQNPQADVSKIDQLYLLSGAELLTWKKRIGI